MRTLSMIHISLIKISFTASLFKKDAHVVPHQTTTATRNTLHMLTAIIKLCTGGTSLSPCSLPSYTCFVPIRTCAQGGYFTLPLLIAIVYVFRTSSYLCAGRVLHSPPAAHSSLTTTNSNQTAMHQRLVGRSIFADIHISCTKTAFTTRPAMASKANISNMTLLT